MTSHCPVCDQLLVDRVYQDQEDDWIQQVWLCNGDPGHEVVIEFGQPLIQEVRDGATGERMKEFENQFA